MSIYKELSYNRDIDVVKGIRFCILSPDEITRMSVAEITKTDTYIANEPVINGLYDPRMGVLDHNKVCQTCQQKNTFCPGHFGHIKLVKPVFYFQFFDMVKKILKCVCFKCSHILVPVDSDEVKAVLNKKYSRQKRWEIMYKMCSKAKKCPCCGAKQPDKITREPIIKVVMEWKDAEDPALKKVVFTGEDVHTILKRISDKECDALGFAPKFSRPEWMICTVLPFPPPAVRPSVKADTGQRSEDDLTHKLCDIVKANKLLQARVDKGVSKEQIDIATQVLQYHVATFIDNQIPGINPAQQRTGRLIKSLSERLKGKEGRIRGNLMGKRVDFSARSVITPDPNISIDELGVPVKIAMNLTFPETVNRYNKEKLTELVRNGPDVYPGAKFIRKPSANNRTFRLKTIDRSTITLETGDIVERHLMDGDYVLFNRQPSLHRHSMLAHRVRVVPYNTFRLNLCVCKCYNADMDGDEMNMHVPQSLISANELREIASVPKQIMSPRECKPIISIVQDTALGVYRMTKSHVYMDDKSFFNLMARNTRFFGELPPPAKVVNGVRMWSGRQALSSIIPKNINIKSPNKSGLDDNNDDKENFVVIENGEILQGRVDTGIYQNRTKGLIHSIFSECGPEETRQFFDNTQTMVCDYLVKAGFSVGISDLIVDEDTKANLKQVLHNMKVKVYDVIRDVHTGRFENKSIENNNDYFEQQINQLLNQANTGAGKLGMSKIDDNANRMINMVKSGSKGNVINVAQMLACLGQQNVDGKRIVYGFDSRTLPHYNKYDDGPEARGFVESSFVKGLTPQEFFFHAMGGREGLIDTAVKTSATGYLQRKLVKAMEDCKVAHDHTVRNASGSIVQFLYGEDGMDPTKIEAQPLIYIDMDYDTLSKEYLITEEDDMSYILDDTTINVMRSTKNWAGRLKRHFEQVLQDREFVIEKIFKGKREKSIMYPVSFMRIINTATAIFGKKGKNVMSDLNPMYVLDTIDNLCEELRVGRLSKGNKFIQILLRCYLSPKQMLRHKIDSIVFDYIVKQVRAKFFDSINDASEMVGVCAAQSIGEPATQLVLNSVHYDTDMLFSINGKLVKTTIGDYIDNHINTCAKDLVEDHPNQTKLAWIDKDQDVKVLSCDKSGRVAWQKVEAVTRHPVINKDGTNTLLKITTQSGRDVICTKAKSLLMKVKNEVIPVDGENLKVGDLVPVSRILPLDHMEKVTHLDVSDFLPKTEWIFMSEVDKANQCMRMNENWWSQHNKKTFTLPYSRSDVFRKASSVLLEKCKKGCVYPRVTGKTTTHLPERIVMDEEFGFVVGAYLAEGCVTDNAMIIANVDKTYRDKISSWCDKYGANYHTITRHINNGVSICLRVTSTVISKLMRAMCGHLAHNKRIPAVMLNANDEFIKGLMDGYYSGDGCVAKRDCAIQTTSTSKSMLEDIRQLLLRYNINSVLRPHKHTEATYQKYKNVHECWDLHVSSGNISTFIQTFKLTNTNKQERLDRCTNRFMFNNNRCDVIPVTTQQFGDIVIHRDKLDDYVASCPNDADKQILLQAKSETVIYDKIISIEEIPNDKPWVYDLTVENTRTFNAYNGICCDDTFHSSGVSSASKVVRGVPRIEELLSVSRNQKSPSLNVYLDPSINQDKLKVKEVMNTIQTTLFGDIVKSSKIYFDPNDFNTTIESDKDFVNSYKDFLGKNLLTTQPTSPWLLRFELDKDKMLDYNINMMDIHLVLQGQYDENVSVMFSDDNANQLVMRFKLASAMDNAKGKKKAATEDEEVPERDYITELKALEKSMMESLIIKGYKKIAKAAMDKVESMNYNKSTMTFEKSYEWVINTAGTNLLELLGHPNIDPYRTISNDIIEIYEIFGIEAAREALYNEINSVISDGNLYINYRHIALLVDTMTNRGYLLAINRHGINRVDVGPLAKCSFEEVTDMITKAGVFAEIDRVTGISANVMLGQIPPCGTGDSQILIDEDKLMLLAQDDFVETQEVSSDSEICTLENLTFDFTMPQPNAMDIITPKIKIV